MSVLVGCAAGKPGRLPGLPVMRRIDRPANGGWCRNGPSIGFSRPVMRMVGGRPTPPRVARHGPRGPSSIDHPLSSPQADTFQLGYEVGTKRPSPVSRHLTVQIRDTSRRIIGYTERDGTVTNTHRQRVADIELD